jgi:pyruvate/2-oxoglutarate dehydrogenase complex dihydrolipoamide dehydrogenase (E3) component
VSTLTYPAARRPRRSAHGHRTVEVSPSRADRFDLVVIGCGPAGEKEANQAAYFGHRVAVVERRSRPGGAAIAVSGVPVKALRDTAVYLSGRSRRDTYGVGIGLAPELVMNRLRARVSDVVATAPHTSRVITGE